MYSFILRNSGTFSYPSTNSKYIKNYQLNALLFLGFQE